MKALINLVNGFLAKHFKDRDSSDLLSPLLVKELRQELRTRSFANFFLWPQLLLAFSVSMDLLSRRYSPSNRMASGLIWGALAVFLYIYLPRRAFISFQKEEKANSMELLTLTNLSAWRIMFGKWIALSSQAVLFLVAMLPYFFLDYLTTGSDLIGSLQFALITVIVAMTLLALGISASASSKGGVSPIIMFGGVLLLIFFATQASVFLFRGFGGSSIFTYELLIVSLVLFPFAVTQLLLMGASRIASVSENYAPQKRLVGLAIIGITALFCLAGRKYGTIALTEAAIVFLPVYCSALFEPVHPLIVKALVRYSPWRVWILYSGWPGGIVYIAFTLLLFLLLATGIDGIDLEDVFLAWFLLLGGILLPRGLLSLFGMATGRSIVVYFIVHLVLGAFAVVSFAFPLTKQGHLAGLFSPIMGAARAIFDNDAPTTLMASSFLSSLIAFGILFLEFNHLQLSLEKALLRERALTRSSRSDEEEDAKLES